MALLGVLHLAQTDNSPACQDGQGRERFLVTELRQACKFTWHRKACAETGARLPTCSGARPPQG